MKNAQSITEIKKDNEVVVRYGNDGSFFEYKHPYYDNKYIKITRMLKNRMLIRMAPKAEKTQSGLLWLPPKFTKRSQVGTVIMKSDEYWDFQAKEWRVNEFQPGATVLFRPLSGIPLYFNTEVEFWFFKPGSIMASIQGLADDPSKNPFTPIGPEADERYPEDSEVDDEDVE